MTKLLKIAQLEIDISQLRVNPINDGGMGSLAIGDDYDNRQLGREVAVCIFKDFDGTSVSASLNIDKQGNLYELDIWKVDFSPTHILT